ncbi:hypothetical protein HWB57_gp094 [Erwinia phage vB_EamM-Bue1]|uniref:Uncharacterized protein n=2 Tax=Nezavisimistyvirus TaxID=2841279 RepID=A0A0A0YVI1_9CAUD|nr:hypothetical protein NW77_083 [Erwinia phage phiEa2809]YP_009837693.1 hypothetical protein HWB57_gp094 [Erwinia phage vB_EamM-Bue1]AIX13091.1 hypothetical protein NW77_083 [Erwinia phage phiEa2809]AVO22934.1 hypothetical protein [Erwinia phage vB_EamM-Bue1]
MKILIPIIAGLCFISAPVHARSVENSSGNVIRLAPEYKDPEVTHELPDITLTMDATPRELSIMNNSICAGYYNASAIGEMGSISSLAGLVFKNDFSADQKLAVRLYTQHVNSYKSQGGISHDAYDLGGRIGGNIFMGGRYIEDGETYTKASMDQYCAKVRKGINP